MGGVGHRSQRSTFSLLSAVCGLQNLVDATGFLISSSYVFISEILTEPNEKGLFITLIGFTRYFESFQ